MTDTGPEKIVHGTAETCLHCYIAEESERRIKSGALTPRQSFDAHLQAIAEIIAAVDTARGRKTAIRYARKMLPDYVVKKVGDRRRAARGFDAGLN